MSAVVPLVAGWRETKLKCTIGLLRGGNCSLWLLFFFLLWTISKCISLFLQMFSLVLFGGTRLAMSAVSDARWPVGSQEGSGGSVHRVPLCCGPLGVKRQSHSAALPPGLHLTLPRLSSSKTWPITALRHSRHLRRGMGWGGRHRSTLLSFLPPPPSLSSLTQRSL